MIAEPSPVAESVCGMTKLKYLGLGPSVAVSADIMLRLCTSLSNLRRLSLTCDETLDDIGMPACPHRPPCFLLCTGSHMRGSSLYGWCIWHSTPYSNTLTRPWPTICGRVWNPHRNRHPNP